MRDNFTSDAPHNKYAEELDHEGVVVTYAVIASLLLVVTVVVWWL